MNWIPPKCKPRTSLLCQPTQCVTEMCWPVYPAEVLYWTVRVLSENTTDRHLDKMPDLFSNSAFIQHIFSPWTQRPVPIRVPWSL
jgi:hypothetical protein